MPRLNLPSRLLAALLASAGLAPAGLMPVQPAAAQQPGQSTAQRIVAVVNDGVITSRDLSERVGLAAVSSGLPEDPETRRRLAAQVLRGLIDEQLQLQEAKRQNVQVEEEEIDRAFASIAERNQMSPEQLVEVMRARGLAPDTLREQIHAQLAWIKVVNRDLRSRVVVTREQVDLALRAGQSGGAELLLSEILLPVYAPEQEAAVMKDAADLVRALRSGAEFAELARQISVARSAQAGGQVGWVPTGSLAPELRSAVAGLEAGQIAEPLRTPQGIHILRVDDRRSSTRSGEADPQAREATRQRLESEALERQASRYLRNLRRDAYIDVRL
ncbi:peptidylprolyl isomerase [Marinimicrococcus flavescens]|uniref:Parvulin-like PPIase n=1 Tax=Marinimicrococcus flavescens TaxID=3031815 RepID=A0AAP3V2L5_9PROT|nr:peptidylprolyl isomerase [Marinimicrococcus flavescens]